MWKVSTSIIVLSFLVTACQNADSKFYKDIDLNTLTGINEISGLKSRPYIQIDSIDERTRNITFQYDRNSLYYRSYKKEGLFWVSHREIHDEGQIFHMFEFCGRDSIINLEYSGNPETGGLLNIVRVKSLNEITEYVLVDGENCMPTHNISKYSLSSAIRVHQAHIQIRNGVLTYTTHITAQGEEPLTGQQCYEVGNLSYFWWSLIGYKMNKIDCGS